MVRLGKRNEKGWIAVSKNVSGIHISTWELSAESGGGGGGGGFWVWHLILRKDEKETVKGEKKTSVNSDRSTLGLKGVKEEASKGNLHLGKREKGDPLEVRSWKDYHSLLRGKSAGRRGCKRGSGPQARTRRKPSIPRRNRRKKNSLAEESIQQKLGLPIGKIKS